jgi:hypothetical protein
MLLWRREDDWRIPRSSFSGEFSPIHPALLLRLLLFYPIDKTYPSPKFAKPNFGEGVTVSAMTVYFYPKKIINNSPISRGRP